MLLEVRDLTKQFPTHSKPTLNNVSFSMDYGERVGIVGASGCGKTTLARIIAGLENANSGSVQFNDALVQYSHDRSKLPRSRNRHVRNAWLDMQMVFQNPQASFSDHRDIGAAVWEGAAYKPQFSGYSKHEQEQIVREALEAVGLSETFVRRRAFELSGGECQRAALARAIIGEPSLIICDEATSALDVTVQARIMDLLQQLYSEKGMAFIFISHNIALVQTFCDRIYSVG